MELAAEKYLATSLKQLDLERVSTVRPPPEPSLHVPTSHTQSSTDPLDISKYITLVPQFRETEVAGFFSAFERITTSLRWPRTVWALLLQCRLSGKAQEALAALSIVDSLSYGLVKTTVLRAYELVPEAYRQKFRAHKKSLTHTYMEFAREKETLFDRWQA